MNGKHKYLLTYNDLGDCGRSNYAWFDTEENMLEYANRTDIEVNEGFYIENGNIKTIIE